MQEIVMIKAATSVSRL